MAALHVRQALNDGPYAGSVKNGMRHNEEFKSFEPDEQVKELIQRRIKKLEAKIQAFPPDSALLRVFIEANSARTLYHVTLMMGVPGKTITAKEEDHDAGASIKTAFDELERQIQKHKDTLRHERLWKRIRKRDELRRMKAVAGKEEETKRNTFFQLVTPHLEWLDHFINHLIRYSEAMGGLVRSELNPEEVVDEAVITAYREFLKNPSIGDVRSWLTRITVDRLDEEINQDVPGIPPQEELWQLGEEIFSFYQPDEDLKAEDVIPDATVSTPEEELAAREIRECISDALRAIPDDWRRILLMRYTNDEAIPKIARSVRKPEREVRRILSFSTKYVRQRLIESGCILADRRRAA
jgi:ribosomal subunit interface protein